MTRFFYPIQLNIQGSKTDFINSIQKSAHFMQQRIIHNLLYVIQTYCGNSPQKLYTFSEQLSASATWLFSNIGNFPQLKRVENSREKSNFIRQINATYSGLRCAEFFWNFAFVLGTFHREFNKNIVLHTFKRIRKFTLTYLLKSWA